MSPESIPNPPGCSYGMDTRYFWYSSEEDDDEEEEKAEGPPAKKSKVEVVYPPPPPITNMSGTFRLDYDTYGSSDEEEEVEGGAIGPSRINAEEALARARLLAEKYKPKQPSGLRASSRLSTSTVNSDVLETPVAAAEVEMDMGVDEAVGTIPEEALLQFTFPGPFPELMEVDPEVQTFLAASWGTEHSHRAHEGFEYGLSEYKREKGLLA